MAYSSARENQHVRRPSRTKSFVRPDRCPPWPVARKPFSGSSQTGFRGRIGDPGQEGEEGTFSAAESLRDAADRLKERRRRRSATRSATCSGRCRDRRPGSGLQWRPAEPVSSASSVPRKKFVCHLDDLTGTAQTNGTPVDRVDRFRNQFQGPGETGALSYNPRRRGVSSPKSSETRPRFRGQSRNREVPFSAILRPTPISTCGSESKSELGALFAENLPSRFSGHHPLATRTHPSTGPGPPPSLWRLAAIDSPVLWLQG